MKCRVCGKQANIRLPQYNRAFCSDDFILFFEKRVADYDPQVQTDRRGRQDPCGGFRREKIAFPFGTCLMDSAFLPTAYTLIWGFTSTRRSPLKRQRRGRQAPKDSLFLFPSGRLHKRDQGPVRDHEEAALLPLWNDQEVRDEQGVHRTRVFGSCNRSQP